MTTIVCTPDYYPAVFVVVGFLVAMVGMFLGRYVRGVRDGRENDD
jgi:hypothetical protein